MRFIGPLFAGHKVHLKSDTCDTEDSPVRKIEHADVPHRRDTVEVSITITKRHAFAKFGISTS